MRVGSGQSLEILPFEAQGMRYAQNDNFCSMTVFGQGQFLIRTIEKR